MRKRDKVFIYIVTGSMLFSALALSLTVLISNSTNEAEVVVQDFAELTVEDLVLGDGQELKLGDTVTVNYRLNLPDGSAVPGNDTFAAGTPATFDLVVGGLIEGWTTGLPGMKVGGTRKLEVPASMGYGAVGRPPAIPGSTGLVFEVELLEIVTQ